MKGPVTAVEKAPILLREDSEYALERLSSILTVDNYEDFGNHATEAMRETDLFTIAQVLSTRLYYMLPLSFSPYFITFLAFRRC